ncbi:MAG TPA: phospholipid carrier-dependent glycosyltransferase [Verrucomicrobiae bacterium]|nr:phospholipid carrier-dependent glycosyltransferase [Verrucomicrobiae bacterium]
MKRHFSPPFDRPVVRWLTLLLGLGLLVGIFARVFWLSYPGVRVFDEVYFPVFAQQYLNHVDVFDVHPPLGKFIIAGGILLFGDTGVGWRIMPLLFGLLSIWLVSALWYALTKDRLASALIAFLIATDGIFIAYSRTGLMDGILFFFMFATLLAMVRNKREMPMLGVATLLGLTLSVKWVGLAVIVPLAYLAYKKEKFNEFLISLWLSFAVYLVVVGLGEWVDRVPDLLQGIYDWNLQAARYHAALTDTHPYASPWWSWPILSRPVLLIYDAAPDGAVQLMTTLGNPLVWWSSSLAVVGSIVHLAYERVVRKVKISGHPLMMPLLGWAAAFLPWALVHRVVFLYHYVPAYGFALIILAYWLAKFFRRDPWTVLALCGLYLIASMYFMPFAVGWWQLSAEALKQHVWIHHWIY